MLGYYTITQKPNDLILDTHLGSGSSAIAAHYFGVDFVGYQSWTKTILKKAKARFDMDKNN